MAKPVKMIRIGVGMPGIASGDILPGCKASVYDLDTGAFLPAEAIDLHAECDGIITATVRLVVSEITVGKGE